MLKRVTIIAILVVLDFGLLFLILATLMTYEDSYVEQQGPFYSLESMDLPTQLAWIGYFVWMAVNLFLFLYLIYILVNKHFV